MHPAIAVVLLVASVQLVAPLIVPRTRAVQLAAVVVPLAKLMHLVAQLIDLVS